MLYDTCPRAQHALDLFLMLVGAVVAVLFIKYSFGFVGSLWSLRESSPDPVVGPPARYVVKAIIPICFGLFGLRCLANAVRDADALRRREA